VVATSAPTPTTALPAVRFFRARARNLARHRLSATIAGFLAGGTVLGALLYMTRAERAALGRIPPAVDTTALAASAGRVRTALLRADSALLAAPPPGAAVRRSVPRPAPSFADAAPAGAAPMPAPATGDSGAVSPVAPAGPIAGIDTLAAQVAALTAGLVRAQNAPLASSWRALASDPALAGDPRARALADSLAAAERARDEYDAVGGVDPIYLELSSRVTATGRAIERLAFERRDALAAAMTGGVVADAGLGPSPAELAARRAADSLRHARARTSRDSVAYRLAAVSRALEDERSRALARDSVQRRAERRVGALAPPSAMLAASAVVGFGVALLVALGLELRRPRVADAGEAATIAGLPVLLVLEPGDARTEEALRSAFAQFAFEVGTSLLRTRALVLVGDDAALALRTAARVAERAAYDGRRVHLAAPRAGQAVMTARPRRATPSRLPALQVEPARLARAEWADVEPVAAVAPDVLRIRAGTMVELQRAIAAESPDAVVVLVARVGETSADWLAQARRDVTVAHGRPPAGVILWESDVEDDDTLAEQVAAALERADERRLVPR
jgi:hypothetical protein